MSSAGGKIEVVVFDLGKVLLDFDYRRASSKLAAHANLSTDEFKNVIDHSPLLFAYETGQIDSERFYREVSAATGFSGKFEQFAECFCDIFTPIEQMIDLHSRLRQRGMPTYIFSNTNPLAVGHMRRCFPFLKDFDGYVFSYEHGAMKPDPKIYEVVEAMIGKRGPALLYIDDRLENIEAAKARGWQVIQHQRPEDTLDSIKQLRLL